MDRNQGSKLRKERGSRGVWSIGQGGRLVCSAPVILLCPSAPAPLGTHPAPLTCLGWDHPCTAPTPTPGLCKPNAFGGRGSRLPGPG